MNEPIPINGNPTPQVQGRHIVITESTPGQWQLESNVPPRDVFVILLELAKNAGMSQMKEEPLVQVPKMAVTLQ